MIWTVAFQMLDSVVEPRAAAYVSGPLQTGRLYYESVAGHIEATTDVRELNGTRLSRFASDLRSRLDYPVLDPGLLVIEGWAGADYLALYLSILERYAKEVWFIDGWQYSTGATAEFRAATQLQIGRLDARGNVIAADEGESLIADAAEEVARWGCDPTVLRTHAA